MRGVVGEPAEWSVNDYLTAHVVDGLNNLLYAYVSSHSKRRNQPPQPVPRPLDPRAQREERRMSTPNEVASFMGQLTSGR